MVQRTNSAAFFCPGCIQLHWTGGSGKCPRCGAEHTFLPPKQHEIRSPVLRFLLRRSKPIGLGTHAGTVVSFLAWFRDGIFWGMGWDLRVLLLVGLIFLIVVWNHFWRAFLWGVAILTKPSENLRRRGWKSFLFGPAILAIAMVLDHYSIPARLALYLSKPVFLANRVSMGALQSPIPAFPYGIYRIQQNGTSNRWMVTDSFEDFEYTSAGYAYCPGDQGCSAHGFSPIHRSKTSDKPSYTPVGGDWYWWIEVVSG